MPRLHGLPPESTFFIANEAPIVCARKEPQGASVESEMAEAGGRGAIVPRSSRQRCCTGSGRRGTSCRPRAGLRHTSDGVVPRMLKPASQPACHQDSRAHLWQGGSARLPDAARPPRTGETSDARPADWPHDEATACVGARAGGGGRAGAHPAGRASDPLSPFSTFAVFAGRTFIHTSPNVAAVGPRSPVTLSCPDHANLPMGTTEWRATAGERCSERTANAGRAGRGRDG